MYLSILLKVDRLWLAPAPGVLILSVLWTIAWRAPEAVKTSGAPAPSSREGFTAPNFTLEQLGSGQVTLSELRGEAVLINFWATWCLPCSTT